MIETVEQVESVNAHPGESGPEHARGLLLIGLFKLSKALFFTLVGAGALNLVHKDLGELVMRFIDWTHIDSEGRLAGFLMDKADLIGHHQLRQGALFAFLYAALCVVEGVGLMKRKVWAEYFTVILTAGALPWEFFELVNRYEHYKVGMIVINLLVLLYLLLVLKHKRAAEQRAAAGR